MHIYKIISKFYKDYLKKLIVISLLIVSTLPIAKFSAKSIIETLK